MLTRDILDRTIRHGGHGGVATVRLSDCCLEIEIKRNNRPISISVLHEIQRIARGAGAILLEHYLQSGTVEWKSPGDPVTEADRNANDFIVSELRRLFPDDAILSEELPDDGARFQRSRIWMVDPMDGTREFIAHREDFAVMIGLIDEGAPVLGVVYQPTTDKLYSAGSGLGASLAMGDSVIPLTVSPEDVAANLTIAVSRSHLSSRVQRISESLRIDHSIPMGSVGLKVGLICEGRAHLYVHPGNYTHIWDTCAPEAILFEAGGRMTDVYGDRLNYGQRAVRNLRGIVASNRAIHDRVLRVTQSIL